MTFNRLAVVLATVAGVGYVPVAPGTFGSLAGLLLWALLPTGGVSQAVVIVIVFVVGTVAATRAEHHFGTVDPGPIVIDEVLGMFMTLFLVPVGFGGACVGFLLFRVFDVVKPFPARQCERLPAGLGVMTDDAMAGIYANLSLRLLIVLAAR